MLYLLLIGGNRNSDFVKSLALKECNTSTIWISNFPKSNRSIHTYSIDKWPIS